MAGEVVAVGEDATQWKTGDRVCANFMLDKLHKEQTPEISASSLGGQSQGVLVEYRTFPAHVRELSVAERLCSRLTSSQSLVSIPSHLTYEEASTLPCASQCLTTVSYD